VPAAARVHRDLVDVRVALPFPGDQWMVDDAPLAPLHVVTIEQHVAAPGTPVAVDEEEIAAGQRVELRIRHLLLALPSHRERLGELERARAHGARVVQRLVVLRPRDVQHAAPVHGE
jgi:hypothetical protein